MLLRFVVVVLVGSAAFCALGLACCSRSGSSAESHAGDDRRDRDLRPLAARRATLLTRE
jgi:hypothetical protein